MERQVYLKRYRLYFDQVGLPTVIRRSATEATFHGEDLRTGHDVAVQIVPVSRTREREQLEAEANAAREFNHINIPILHDFGFDDGHIICVTEYFEGTTAEDWVETKGLLPVGAVLRIAVQVVNATSAATFHGLVHHAINPSNIMLVPGQTNEGEWPLIKMLNLVGLAPQLMSSAVRDLESADPLNFASPEQLQTGAVDFRSQMYSLGATLWFLLTGAAPADGVATVESTGRLPAIVRQLLAQMLAIDPEERPLDPIALQAQIQDCLAQLERRDAVASKLGLPLATEAIALKDAPSRRSIWRPIGLAALFIGLAALTGFILSTRARPQAALGVPIGVPENSAVPPAPQPPSVVVDGATAEPPVLTSTADASTEEQKTSTTEMAADENVGQPNVEIASAPTEVSPNESTEMQPAIAAADNSPPPTETTESSASAETVIVQTRPTPEPPQPPTTNESQAILAVATPDDRPTPIAPRPQKPRVAKTVPQPTSAPHGMERAQFLGMTPDGNLVFGSSSDKVLTAPPASREDSPRRKPSPRPTREMIDGLPVRPALPPDQ